MGSGEPHPRGVEILLVSSCCPNRDKLRPDRSVGRFYLPTSNCRSRRKSFEPHKEIYIHTLAVSAVSPCSCYAFSQVAELVQVENSTVDYLNIYFIITGLFRRFRCANFLNHHTIAVSWMVIFKVQPSVCPTRVSRRRCL